MFLSPVVLRRCDLPDPPDAVPEALPEHPGDPGARGGGVGRRRRVLGRRVVGRRPRGGVAAAAAAPAAAARRGGGAVGGAEVGQDHVARARGGLVFLRKSS